MRKVGSFEYKQDAEELILTLINETPKTTKDLTEEAKKNFYSKVHATTIKRLLNNLLINGKIKLKKVNKICLWFK